MANQNCSFLTNAKINEFMREILPRFQKLYFCGHPLNEVHNRAVFRRLPSMTKRALGFCYECAAINMIALRDMPNARLMRGTNIKGGWHSWVEVDLSDWVIAIDPCWIFGDPGVDNRYFLEQRQLYEATELTPKTTYTYEEFWNLDLAHELYHELSDVELSYAASHLLGAFRPTEGKTQGDQFNPAMRWLAGNEPLQRQFVEQMVDEGFLPVELIAAVNRLMEDRMLGNDFQQPPDMKPDV